MSGLRIGKYWWLMLALLTLSIYGCGDGSSVVKPPDGSCVNMDTATYVGTEDVGTTSGPCPSYTNLAVTFNIAQAAGSCAFTLKSSLVAGTTFPGTVSGSKISWTGSYPSASGSVTVNSVDATVSADLTTITGSFTWTYAGNTSCTGTTTFNVVKQ